MSLTNTEQIARLIGYDTTTVDAALDRLECGKLIDRSRLSRGSRMYRIVDPTDAEQRRHLHQLISLSETRAGRLLLLNALKDMRREVKPEEHKKQI